VGAAAVRLFESRNGGAAILPGKAGSRIRRSEGCYTCFRGFAVIGLTGVCGLPLTIFCGGHQVVASERRGGR